MWKKIVMKKKRVFPRALLQASSGAIVQAVSKNKNAIGYIGYGYMNIRIKQVLVNGIFGNKTTTLNGTYPISRPLFMFTLGWPEGDTARFMKYLLHPEKGQKIVEAAGFVPLY